MADGDKIELTQSELDAKISTAVEAGLAKLQTKNSELTDELKKSRKRVEAFADLDPADVKKAMESARTDRQKALENKEEYDTALAEAKTNHQNEITALQGKLDSALGVTKQLRVDTALDAAMDKAGIPAHFKKAVKAMFSGEVEITEEDGKHIANIGDQPIGEHFTAWADTDEGKHYVGDGGNGGGGGGGGDGGNGQANPWAKDTRNLTEQGQMERDNPDLANQLKREAGVSA
jgi:hypothetical protein